MKNQISFACLSLVILASCKTNETPKTVSSDLGIIEAVNMNPVNLKTGPIVCPKEATLRFLENSNTMVECYTEALFKTPDKGVTVENNELKRPLVCLGKIKITSKTTGVCQKTS